MNETTEPPTKMDEDRHPPLSLTLAPPRYQLSSGTSSNGDRSLGGKYQHEATSIHQFAGHLPSPQPHELPLPYVAWNSQTYIHGRAWKTCLRSIVSQDESETGQNP
ncbi:unnamed protein product [Ectocarpus fasciculatus]